MGPSSLLKGLFQHSSQALSGDCFTGVLNFVHQACRAGPVLQLKLVLMGCLYHDNVVALWCTRLSVFPGNILIIQTRLVHDRLACVLPYRCSA